MICVDSGRGSLGYEPLSASGGDDQNQQLITKAKIHNQRCIWWKVSTTGDGQIEYVGSKPTEWDGYINEILGAGFDKPGNEPYLKSKNVAFRLDLWNAISDPWMELQASTRLGKRTTLKTEWKDLAVWLDLAELALSLAKTDYIWPEKYKTEVEAVTIKGVGKALQRLKDTGALYSNIPKAYGNLTHNNYFGAVWEIASWYASNPTGTAQKDLLNLISKELANNLSALVIKYSDLRNIDITEVSAKTALGIALSWSKFADACFAIANAAIKVNDVVALGLSGGDYMILEDTYTPMVTVDYLGADVRRFGNKDSMEWKT